MHFVHHIIHTRLNCETKQCYVFF